MRRFLVWLFVLSTAACGLVIGLEERPGRPPKADAQREDATLPEAAPPRWCDTEGKGAFFCDDFDEPDQELSKHWEGIKGAITSPLVNSDASVELESLANGAHSPPHAFHAEAIRMETDKKPTAGIVFQEFRPALDGSEAIVVSAYVKVMKVERAGSPAPPPDAGDAGDADADVDAAPPGDPLLEEPLFLSLAIGKLAVRGAFSGAALTIGERNVLVAELDEVSAGISLYARAAEFQLNRVHEQSWTKIFLATGMRERVIDAIVASRDGAQPQCPQTPYVTAAWVGAIRDQSGCIESPVQFNPVSTKAPFTIAIGLLLPDNVSARVRYDSVRVDVLK